MVKMKFGMGALVVGFGCNADCSDADSPEGYICDICNRHLRKTEMNN